MSFSELDASIQAGMKQFEELSGGEDGVAGSAVCGAPAVTLLRSPQAVSTIGGSAEQVSSDSDSNDAAAATLKMAATAIRKSSLYNYNAIISCLK